MPVLYNDGDLRTNPNTTIDLDGPRGNALVLTGIFGDLAQQGGWTEDLLRAYLNEDIFKIFFKHFTDTGTFYDFSSLEQGYKSLQQGYKEIVRKIAWHFPSYTLITTDKDLVSFCNGGEE